MGSRRTNVRNTTLVRPDRCFDPFRQMAVHVDVVTTNDDVFPGLPSSHGCGLVDLRLVVHEAGSPGTEEGLVNCWGLSSRECPRSFRGGAPGAHALTFSL